MGFKSGHYSVSVQQSGIFSPKRRTDAFTWPSTLRHFLKYLPNLLSPEQPLLLVLDVFSVGWAMQSPSEDAAEETLAKTTHNIPPLNIEGLTENKISVIE